MPEPTIPWVVTAMFVTEEDWLSGEALAYVHRRCEEDET